MSIRPRELESQTFPYSFRAGIVRFLIEFVSRAYPSRATYSSFSIAYLSDGRFPVGEKERSDPGETWILIGFHTIPMSPDSHLARHKRIFKRRKCVNRLGSEEEERPKGRRKYWRKLKKCKKIDLTPCSRTVASRCQVVTSRPLRESACPANGPTIRCLPRDAAPLSLFLPFLHLVPTIAPWPFGPRNYLRSVCITSPEPSKHAS